jgi:hypothetical protein
MHPTEQKLIEIVLVSLYMNHAWLSMPMASHVDVETLSQSAKKQYLLKLGEIEKLFNKRQKERQSPYAKLLKFNSHSSSDSFRSFEWTPSRQQTFDDNVQQLLDEYYSIIDQTFQDSEFDRDQYAYYDDNTKQLFANLASPYARLQIRPTQNYYLTPQQPFL